MYESPEPLTTFFEQLIPAAHAAGYKLILTLLAREADAEEIFRDLERYWSSLDDVTGEHILFVLGTHQAASKFPHTGIRERREPVNHVNPNVAINGSREIYWSDSSSNYRCDLWHIHDVPSKDLARSHSREIASLRNMFGLREDTIPALLLFVLEGDLPKIQPLVLPISIMGQSTIYRFLKKLIGEMEDHFVVIQEQRAALADLNHRFKKGAKNQRWWLPQEVSLKAVNNKPNIKEAADQIMFICRSSTDQIRKRECFDLLQIIKAEIGGHAILTCRLQSLIDCSFRLGSLKEATHYNQREMLMVKMNDVRAKEADAWQKIRAHLQLLQMEPKASITQIMLSWDYFIAYSSRDSWYADRLYSELSKFGKVFLDRLCLRPGDIWPQRLRLEQDRARCSIVLLTRNTDQAWFANSEYIHAIELARSGEHRVVPLLVGSDAKIPYGLDQVHAIKHEGHGDFSTIARQIAEALTG